MQAKTYKALHKKRNPIEIYARDAYDAAKVAAVNWGFRHTSGITIFPIKKTLDKAKI